MELIVKIKDWQRDKSILEDAEHNLIYWPKDKLPPDSKIGDCLKISLRHQADDLDNIGPDPKKILNEILKSDPDSKSAN